MNREGIMNRFSIVSIIYIVIGIIMASNRGYLGDLGSIPNFLSAVIAVILWPLLFLGVNLRITF